MLPKKKPRKKSKITRKGTEKAVQARKQVTASEFEEIRSQVNAMIEGDSPGPVAPPLEVPVESSASNGREISLIDTENLPLRTAFLEEGMDARFFAQKINFLLSEQAKVPKWNKETGQWDYFIDGGLWAKLIDMGIKVHGGYAPERSINLNVDAKLEDILKSTSISPEDQHKAVNDYFQKIAKEIGEEAIDVEAVESDKEPVISVDTTRD